MLAKFPIYARGHQRIARHYLFTLDEPELAIEHMQKAMLLDSRIEGKNLGETYYKMGEREKTIAIYQGVSKLSHHHILNLTEAQSELNGLADYTRN